jgi:hypothetical protein
MSKSPYYWTSTIFDLVDVHNLPFDGCPELAKNLPFDGCPELAII